jgi:GGDEF domain-containing protein
MPEFQPEDRRIAAALAPPAIAGIVVIALASGFDAPLAVIAFAVIAIVSVAVAAWRVIVVERAEPREEQTDAQVASVRTDRRRPTFDRETGLLAAWYFRQRLDEEIARADRYRHDLTVVTVATPTHDDFELVRLAARAELRQVDFAGDLHGTIAVVLPDTPPDGAAIVANRLRALAPGIDVTARAYPAGGATPSALLGESSWLTTREPSAGDADVA